MHSDISLVLLRAVGGKIDDFPDIATARHVGIDFTIAAAKAILTDMSLTTSIPDHRKFKFIYCSGWGAEWDQDVKLYVEQENRRLKVRSRFNILAFREMELTTSIVGVCGGRTN